MAVTIIIGDGADERRFEVAPFKLKQLRMAAPFVEEMNEVAKRLAEEQKAIAAAKAAGEPPPAQNLDDMFRLSRLLCEIIAIGVQRVDPLWNADHIEDHTGIDAITGLQIAVQELLSQSGLSTTKSGESKPPSQEAAAAGAEEALPAS
jgi:hypothetical protein